MLVSTENKWNVLSPLVCAPASSLLVAYTSVHANMLADPITFAHPGGRLSRKESARRHYVEHSESIRRKARLRAARCVLLPGPCFLAESGSTV
jgi:hypothetical protein